MSLRSLKILFGLDITLALFVVLTLVVTLVRYDVFGFVVEALLALYVAYLTQRDYKRIQAAKRG